MNRERWEQACRHEAKVNYSCATVSAFFVAHLFSSTSNVAVDVRFHCAARRNKSLVNDALDVKNKQTNKMRIFSAAFGLGICGLLHCDNCCVVFGS